MDPRPIGIFDSGLGGLSVARALIDLLPDERLLYFGDTARFPYGPKGRDEVVKYAIEITDLLVERGAKLVIVACNSASAVALDELRARHDVPIMGVVGPGVRAAMKATSTGRVGVVGTVGTIASGAYPSALAALDPGRSIELTAAACPGFVEFVEAGEIDSDQVHVLAERLLAPVRAAGVDVLVLGCTHYPLMARTIADVMGRGVVLVSSGEETAFEVGAHLREGKPPPAPTRTAGGPEVDHRFFTSGDPETFRRLGSAFCGPEVERVERHEWS